MNDPFRNYDAWLTTDPNMECGEESNDEFEDEFSDFDSLYALYRAVYKATPCGPSLGVTVYGEFPADPGQSAHRTFYCDDLKELGTYQDMRENGLLIMGLHVGSIVEGTEQACETLHLEWNPWDTDPWDLKDEFWRMVEQVDQEADQIWRATHECDTCRELWGDEFMDDEQIPAHEDCPDCQGEGTVL